MDRHRNYKRKWRGKGNLKNYLQRKRGQMNPRRDSPGVTKRREKGNKESTSEKKGIKLNREGRSRGGPIWTGPGKMMKDAKKGVEALPSRFLVFFFKTIRKNPEAVLYGQAPDAMK